VEMMKIESDPNFQTLVQAREPAVPVVAVAVPFWSTGSIAVSQERASVIGISSPIVDRRVPHPEFPEEPKKRQPRIFTENRTELDGWMPVSPCKFR